MRQYQFNLIRALITGLVVVLLSTAAGYYMSKYFQPKVPQQIRQREFKKRAPSKPRRVNTPPFIDEQRKFALV